MDPLLDRAGFSPEDKLAVRAVAEVFPFRTNQYVVDELIDWANVSEDPIFNLVFPQRDMLAPADLVRAIVRFANLRERRRK